MVIRHWGLFELGGDVDWSLGAIPLRRHRVTVVGTPR